MSDFFHRFLPSRTVAWAITAAFSTAILSGCGESAETTSISINGSSTVFPVSQLAAEGFRALEPNVNVDVSASGTSAGMGMFLKKEIDICDASRPIKDSELETAAEAGIEIIEFVVGLDGLAVVVNKENDWCDSMTVEQLKALWREEAEGTVMNWNQVDESWPDMPFKLFGPGLASGTFEYFTEVICETKKKSRNDYQPSENDDMLVRGVFGEKGGLAYFGYAYYATNMDKLKLVGVDNGNGPVTPSVETVRDGSYAPLSRPIFIYVNKQLLSRPEGRAFVSYYVENAGKLAEEALYVAPDEATAAQNKLRLEEALKQ